MSNLQKWTPDRPNAARITGVNPTEAGVIVTLDGAHVKPGTEVRRSYAAAWAETNNPTIGDYLVEHDNEDAVLDGEAFERTYVTHTPPSPELVLLKSALIELLERIK
tara:strand:+ start:4202 stop:4522 length:321 start_codon:yes stop_codon:yes gene_type:complete